METIADRIQQAIAFLAVVEEGSFTAAAARLGSSKAQVSKQVSALEAGLGAQLLFRSTRSLSLTETGRLYLDYCRQLRDTAQAAEQAVAASRHEVAGILRLSAAPTFAGAFLLDLVHAFRRLYPGISFELDLSRRRKDLAREGIDFGFRSGHNVDEDLVARPIGQMRDVPVASPVLLNRLPPLRAPEDLAGQPCIANTHFRDDPAWVLERGGEARTVGLAPILSLNDYGMIRTAALEGMGLARLPGFQVHRDLEAGALVRLLPDWKMPALPIHLVWPQRRNPPHRNRVFREFALAFFADPQRAALLR
ncbi:LysR family transcriptional regulator [Vulgatibacter sp.]|uniref:LysR family transcriptional regulator n=1 Tax=Vulgatibacter sp. TaxID=1971226 RepID=UPI0035629C8F